MHEKAKSRAVKTSETRFRLATFSSTRQQKSPAARHSGDLSTCCSGVMKSRRHTTNTERISLSRPRFDLRIFRGRWVRPSFVHLERSQHSDVTKFRRPAAAPIGPAMTKTDETSSKATIRMKVTNCP